MPVARSNKNPADMTGRLKEELAIASAEEIAVKQEELGMLTTMQRAASKEVVDLTEKKPVVEVKETTDVDTERRPVRVSVNSEVENMTFGHGQEYNLKPGTPYLLPAEVADHLDRLGYIWHEDLGL